VSISITVANGSDFPELKPRITVIGIGGAGDNAIRNMVEANLKGVDFVAANTDAQSLSLSKATHKLQLGMHLTQGLGAGAQAEIGRSAAEESLDSVRKILDGSHMVFITAGMGGGTGTGAAPVIAAAARELGILTIGIVTKPFQFEGARRMRIAETGIEELSNYVDTLITIPNQNLFRIADEKTTFADAFSMADNVLLSGVRSVTDLMTVPGMINLDFADVHSIMSGMGKAMMGMGEADGEGRALEAAEAAIANPLLDDTSMKGAKGVLINITGGPDMTLFEVDAVANRIRAEVDETAYVIFGTSFNESLQGRMRVSVVATGIGSESGCLDLPGNATIPEPDATPAPQLVSELSCPLLSELELPLEQTQTISPESDIPAIASENYTLSGLEEAVTADVSLLTEFEQIVAEPPTHTNPDNTDSVKRAIAQNDLAPIAQMSDQKKESSLFGIPSFLRRLAG